MLIYLQNSLQVQRLLTKKKNNFYSIPISSPFFKGAMKAQDWMPWQQQTVSSKRSKRANNCPKFNNRLLLKTVTWLEKWHKNAGGEK